MIFRYKIKFISDIEQKIRKLLVNIAVTPFVGVWIEINFSCVALRDTFVTPFVGVWIEICYRRYKLSCLYLSLPSWECGLKSIIPVTPLIKPLVAPFVGVWIEILR